MKLNNFVGLSIIFVYVLISPIIAQVFKLLYLIYYLFIQLWLRLIYCCYFVFCLLIFFLYLNIVSFHKRRLITKASCSGSHKFYITRTRIKSISDICCYQNNVTHASIGVKGCKICSCTYIYVLLVTEVSLNLHWLQQ